MIDDSCYIFAQGQPAWRTRQHPEPAPLARPYVVVIAPDAGAVELRRFTDEASMLACLREQLDHDADIVVVQGDHCPCLANPLRIVTTGGVLAVAVAEPPEEPRAIGRLGRPRDYEAASKPKPKGQVHGQDQVNDLGDDNIDDEDAEF